MAISAAGIGSGLDIEGIISSLMAAERIPLNTISQQRSQTNARISTYGSIKSAFANLNTIADKLSKLTNLYPTKVTSSNESMVSGTATGSKANGNYNIEVSQLAKAQSVAAPRVGSSTEVVGTGTLTLTMGTYTAGNNTFTPDAAKTPLNIVIGAGQQTLEGVRNAINDANAEVSASIVNDGTGARLVVTSKSTGEANSFKIDVSDDDGVNNDLTGLSKIAFDPTTAAAPTDGTTAEFLEKAQNAIFTVNNLTISKPSNTVSDAIEGLTLNLKAVTTGPVQLGVATDNEALKTSMDELVKSYNDIRKLLKDQQKKDATLSRDVTPGTLERQLRNIMRETVGSGASLNSIGMSFDKDGVLALDKAKMDTALAADPRALEKLFADTATFTNADVKFVGAGSLAQQGTYAINISNPGGDGNTIAGTIGGFSATGVSTVLTGGTGTAVEGLKISVTPGVSGDLGTMSFSKGMGSRLSDWIDSLNEDNGALASKTESLNSKLGRLDDQKERMDFRLEQIEKRYRAQFTALDSMLASMQQTSSYLTQQLAALSSSSR